MASRPESRRLVAGTSLTSSTDRNLCIKRYTSDCFAEEGDALIFNAAVSKAATKV